MLIRSGNKTRNGSICSYSLSNSQVYIYGVSAADFLAWADGFLQDGAASRLLGEKMSSNNNKEPTRDSLDNIAVLPAAASSNKDLDDAYELYKKQDATDIDPAEARRVLRKIDLHIMPLLMITYCLQYLDKASINFASVYGLKEGTHLVGQDYSWLSSIFYFGEFAWQCLVAHDHVMSLKCVLTCRC